MLRSACILAMTAAAGASALAQTSAPLLPPAGLYARYWPLQIVQWVGPELPYSTITLYVDDRGKQPAYDAVLTERAGGKRTHYCNTPELLAEEKRKGDDAYQVAMALDKPETPGKGAQYLLRFNTEKGVPVVWRFVELTDVSEQGSGVTPIEAPFPMLLYREAGALAGDGTALKVGDATSAADVWKQYAQPPYFVPYHGALTQGAHIVSLAPVQAGWTGAQPATLTEGASWTLTGSRGTVLTAHVDALKGQAVTVSFTNETGDAETLEAERSTAGWALSRVRLGPVGAKLDSTVSLAFTPALGPGVASRFEMLAGKKTKLAAGSVQTGADGLSESWTVSSPDEMKGKAAAASVNLAH